MSPEQASGAIATIDGRSDQWSLGVILYELLAGARPFQGDTMQIMYAIQHQDVPRPRSQDPNIPLDLDTICMRCLARDPKDRFSSCAELAQDLERWLNDEPIVSRDHSLFEKMQRWSRRNPVVALLSATLLASILILGSLMAFQWYRAEISANTATRLYVEAERQREELSQKNRQLVESEEALTGKNQELEATLSNLRIAKETIETTSNELQTKLDQIEQQRKEIDQVTVQKDKAEDVAKTAQTQSELEKQLRVSEQQKNQKLRYVGDIAGAQAAIASGKPDIAQELLDRTPEALRSVEWQLCKQVIESTTPRYVCIGNSAQTQNPEFGFLRSIGFPANAISPSQVTQLLRAERVLSVSDSARRWICQGSPADILDAHLPRDYVPFVSGQLPPDLRAQYATSRLIVESLDPIAFSIDRPVVNAWLSPDGRYLACVHLQAESKVDSPPSTTVTIRVARELVLYDLDETPAPGAPFQVKVLERYPDEVFRVTRSQGPSGTVYAYQALSPIGGKEASGFFSNDSAQFFAIHEGSIAVWGTYQAREQPDAKVALAGLHPKTSSLRIDDERVLVATEGYFYRMGRKNLSVLDTIECKWPIASPDSTLFSRNGLFLGLIRVRNEKVSTRISRPRLDFFVYSTLRKKWFDCSLDAEAFQSHCDANQSLNNKQSQQHLASQRIMRLDRVTVEVIEDSSERWLNLELGVLGTFSFIYLHLDQIAPEPQPVWELGRTNLKGSLQMAIQGSRFWIGARNRLIALEKQPSTKSWSFVNEELFGNGDILQMVPDVGGKVWVSRPDGLECYDSITDTIANKISISEPVSMVFVSDGLFACSHASGNLDVFSKSDGRMITNLQAQRNVTLSLAYDSNTSYLVAGGMDRHLLLWNSRANTAPNIWLVDTPTLGLHLNARSNLLTQIGLDRSIRIYRWPDLKLLHMVVPSSDTILRAEMSNDGKRLILVGEDGIKLLDPEYGILVCDVIRFPSLAASAVLDSNQSRAFVCLTDGRILEYEFLPATPKG
jgi:hypothetical protein